MESLFSADDITRERWRKALDLVESASDAPAADQAAWLARICGEDPQLRATVRELLAAATAAEREGFMEQPLLSYAPPGKEADDPEQLIGQQLGVWRLTRFVSAGGMGRVYLAERTDGLFERQVAIKVMGKDLSEQAYQRFHREVRILSALQHPNLVFLHDAGRTQDGQPYLVMEYLPGPDLRTWLRKQGALPAAQILDLTRQICAGLHAAHQAGVIHRDLKPGNLIVTEAAPGELTVKLLDFGLAYRQPPQAFDTALTRADQQLGTPAYMSPEQVRGLPHEQLTPATDLYALGLIVYEMLTGRRAFLSETSEEVKADQLRQLPTPPSAARPDLTIPKAVDEVVLKAVAKDPMARFQSAPEFISELVTAFQTPQPPPPFPWRQLALAGLLLGLLAGPAYWFWPQAPTAPPEVTANPAALAPSPAASTPSGGLQVLLRVRNGAKQPLPGSQFELFNTGADPRTVPPLCARTTGSDGAADCGALRMPPGVYWVRVRQAGYKNFEGQVQLSESKRQPGTVRLAVALEAR